MNNIRERIFWSLSLLIYWLLLFICRWNDGSCKVHKLVESENDYWCKLILYYNAIYKSMYINLVKLVISAMSQRYQLFLLLFHCFSWTYLGWSSVQEFCAIGTAIGRVWLFNEPNRVKRVSLTWDRECAFSRGADDRLRLVRHHKHCLSVLLGSANISWFL